MAPRDPFRGWLRTTNLRDVAIRLALSTQAVAYWRAGESAPRPKHYRALKAMAAKEGVKLTTDDFLLPVPALSSRRGAKP